MNCAMEWVCYFPFSYKYVLVWRDLLQNNGFKASRVCDAGSCSHILVNARDCPAQGGADRVNAQVCTHVVISSRPRTSNEDVACQRGLENYAIIIFDRFSPYIELFLVLRECRLRSDHWLEGVMPLSQLWEEWKSRLMTGMLRTDRKFLYRDVEQFNDFHCPWRLTSTFVIKSQT